MTIVIPLLAYYAEHFGASPLVATLLVSVYAACSLVSSPILGRWSDTHGRRKILLISQLGTCLGFIMLALANSLWLVFLGRMLDGATAGNLSIAQAYVSDHTTPENRAKAFGVIGVAFGIGFLFGPLMSGKIAAAYGLHAPFVVAAALSALSIICTATLLTNDLPPSQAPAAEPVATTADGALAAPAPGRRASVFDLRGFASYFARKELAVLLVLFFVFQFSFSLFVSNFALFAERQYTVIVDAISRPWGANEVGLLLAYTGLLGIILQGGLIGRLVKAFGERKLIIAGFVASAVAYALLDFGVSITWILVVATISSFGNGVLRPAVTSLLSKASGAHEQGAVMGVSQSLGSIAMALAPPLGGFLIGHGQLMAWTLVMAAVAGGGAMLCLSYVKQPTP
ncbi:MAG: MFS transporter [Myxococcales bacterium]|nr:MFS transporter [Myxococcales bacterium]